MSRESELTQALVDAYYVGGREIGYWGRRFLQAVRRNGGLATVRRMLQPRTPGQRKGLDAALDAGRPDITVEAVILRPRFRSLFTDEELRVAEERLGDYGREIARRRKARERIFPEELPPGPRYSEGAKKQVRVNAYERDSRARKACLGHHGYVCSVCSFDFEKRYGQIGSRFIHVHHLKPLSLTNGEYKLDPVADLRPVCPNCHAMLHREDPPISIRKLQGLLHRADG